MDLCNDREVKQFLSWVKESQDAQTAEKCLELIGKMKEAGQTEVLDAFDLLTPAYNAVHQRQIEAAVRLVNSPFDSRVKFE